MDPFRTVHISGYAREAHDFYPTPDWVTACLLRHVRLRGPVWEPCCGDGAIARVLQAHHYLVVASDAEDRGFGTLAEGTLDTVLVLTRRIRWFEMGDKTNAGQHHHAWIVFDAARDRSPPARVVFDQ